MAWRCRFITARPSQDSRVIAEKRLSEELSGAPDALVDFYTGIDRHSSWFRKEKDVKVDKAKKKPPQDINKLG